MCEQYDDADKTLEPLRYLEQRVDGSKSRRHEKLAAQVVRNDSKIMDVDLEANPSICGCQPIKMTGRQTCDEEGWADKTLTGKIIN